MNVWSQSSRILRWVSVAVLPLALACSSEAEQTPAGGSGGSGGAGAAGGSVGNLSTGQGGATTGAGASGPSSGSISSGSGAGGPNGAEHIPAHNALEQCADGQSLGCDGIIFLSVWGVDSGDIDSSMPCLLTALRDRTPGLYVLERQDGSDNATKVFQYSMYITPSGAVERGLVTQTIDFLADPPQTLSVTYSPTERCEPQSAAYFDACLAHFGPGLGQYAPEAWDCIAPNGVIDPPWFSSCEPALPTCE